MLGHGLLGYALAVAYGLHQTRFYTLGCPDLTVATDHKPLLGLLNERSLADISNRRLLNLKEKTLSFNFKILHVLGKRHLGADAASRYPASPAELLKLPGEPELSSVYDESLYEGMTRKELRHLLTDGLCTLEDSTDADILECCTIGESLGAIKSTTSLLTDFRRIQDNCQLT